MRSFTCTYGRIYSCTNNHGSHCIRPCTFNRFVCYLDQPRLIEWYFCMNQGLGTGKPARVKRNFELSDLELSEVNLVTLWRRKFGTGRKTRVIRKFELSEFELTGFNCRCTGKMHNRCAFSRLIGIDVLWQHRWFTSEMGFHHPPGLNNILPEVKFGWYSCLKSENRSSISPCMS